MNQNQITATLPVRSSPVPRTDGPFPHCQVSDQGSPHLGAEILERVRMLDGVEIKDSFVSVPGAIAFHLQPEMARGPAAAFVKNEEFGHLHPVHDSSLHLMARPSTAVNYRGKGWAESHPEVDGLLLVYGPRTPQEREVVWEIVLDTYRYASGQ